MYGLIIINRFPLVIWHSASFITKIIAMPSLHRRPSLGRADQIRVEWHIFRMCLYEPLATSSHSILETVAAADAGYEE
jgi:hypothetical protein